MGTVKEPAVEPIPKSTKNRFFYGWWILGAGTLGSAINASFFYLGFGVFFLPISETFNASKTSLSGAIALARMEAGLLGPIGGFLIDRLGSRVLMLAGVTLMGTGFVLLSVVPSLLWFYVVFVCLVALGSAWGFGPPVHATVVNWFVKRRTKALALVLSGTGLAGVVVPAIAWFIGEYGWRPTAFFTGISVWCLGYPIALVMRYRPEDYGYYPDDLAPHKRAAGEPEIDSEIDFTTREALQTMAFWVLGISTALRMLASSAVPIHLVPYFEQDLGYSTGRAALFLGLIGPVGLSGRVVFGVLGDVLSKRHVLSAALAIQAASMILLANIGSTWEAVLFLVLFSASHSGGAAVILATRASFFGRKAYATIAGCMSTVMLAGTVAGPLIAGLFRDRAGSYEPAWYVIGGLVAVGSLGLLFVQRPVPKRLAVN